MMFFTRSLPPFCFSIFLFFFVFVFFLGFFFFPPPLVEPWLSHKVVIMKMFTTEGENAKKLRCVDLLWCSMLLIIKQGMRT